MVITTGFWDWLRPGIAGPVFPMDYYKSLYIDLILRIENMT